MKDSLKLLVSVFLDGLGMVSYFIPFFGELSDVILAPIQAWWIWRAYGTKIGAVLGALEEILPFTDIIPSCTIIHFLRR